MRIAIEGCAHGALETIYDVIEEAEKLKETKVDLLICCGDFQATRNFEDLQCMAVPDKFKEIGSFYKYYSGEKIAPVLTIFIGGNHEASNYLQEFPYGGWVAPNIYYMGYANVINIGGIRIAGLSGIYKGHDYLRGHFECSPYDPNSLRSVYHVRNLEVFRLKQISKHVDIFISHDWPAGVTQFGDVQDLLSKKPFFKNDIENNSLGSPPAMELLQHHYPTYWFSAHLHCKFAALVTDKKDNTRRTKFLSLDKCLPRRNFLQIIDIEHDDNLPIKISYDLEWLTVLNLTNSLSSEKRTFSYMPGSDDKNRWCFTPTEEEKEYVLQKFDNDLSIPLNFSRTAEAYNPTQQNRFHKQPHFVLNEQTIDFCKKLEIQDPLALMKMATPKYNENLDQSNSSTPNNSFNSTTSMPETPTKHDRIFDSEEDNKSELFKIDTTPETSFKQMTPMKLPSVRANNSLQDETEDDIELKRQLAKTAILEETNSEIGAKRKSPSLKSSDIGNTEESDSSCDKKKKFRRRNQIMYASSPSAD